jgi:adenylate cyclase
VDALRGDAVEDPVQRRLAAILAADVAGYSRLTGADEEGTLARLRALRRELIKPAIAALHGRIVKTTGDGILVEFGSVVDAVRLAVVIQRGMIARNRDIQLHNRIEFRVGINLGDVVAEGDDLLGDGVNIAARLEGLAEPGGICISDDAYRHVRDKLPLPFTDLGERSVKNIARPLRVYALDALTLASLADESVSWRRDRARRPPWFRPVALASVTAMLLAVAVWLAVIRVYHSQEIASAPRLSIVVLPFATLGGDQTQNYLADAITEELTTSLARLPGTFVIARSTAFTYKDKAVNVKQVGQELGIRYVLEGSAESSGERVRVNAQLIDAGTGAHLWADQFDERRADLLQMQDEIVTRLARALNIQFTTIEATRVSRARTNNVDAETLTLRCQAIVFNYGANRNEVAAAYPLCEQALKLDPNIARALAILARRYALQALQGQSTDRTADIARADELISRAIAIDPNDYYVRYVKAIVLETQGRQEEAIVQAERCLALNPSHINAYAALWVANFYSGRVKQAIEYVDVAIRLSPRDPLLYEFYFEKGSAYFALGDYKSAIEWLRRATVTDPDYSTAYEALAATLALVGQQAEARDTLAKYLSLPQTKTKTIAQVKPATAHWPIAGRVIEGLRKAGMPEQ